MSAGSTSSSIANIRRCSWWSLRISSVMSTVALFPARRLDSPSAAGCPVMPGTAAAQVPRTEHTDPVIAHPSGRGGRTARELAADPLMVTLDGIHPVKHALRFGAEVELLVTTDRAATLRLVAALAPDVAERVAAAVTVDPAVPGRLPAYGRTASWSASPGVRPRHPTGRPRRPCSWTTRATPAISARSSGWRPGSAPPPCSPPGPSTPGTPRSYGRAPGCTSRRPWTGSRSTTPAWPTAVRCWPSTRRARTSGRVRLPDRAVLAFGSERHGLSAEVRGRADRLVAIPMRELVSSYNLATSVAVGLYHWSLGRRGRPGCRDRRPEGGVGPRQRSAGAGSDGGPGGSMAFSNAPSVASTWSSAARSASATC